jgi:hypothetical protein
MKAVLLILILALTGCHRPRFEVLVPGDNGYRAVVFDHDTNEVLLVDHTGNIQNIGKR